MIRKTVMASLLLALTGCSTVEMLDSSPVKTAANDCNVIVYQTLKQAEKNGQIEELCIVTGTSSGSFSHTVATAVEKHKSKACQCGATNVYIQSRTDGDLGLANVTMVAFRYAGKKTEPGIGSETLKRARLCQTKGGVWVNDVCQIPLD